MPTPWLRGPITIRSTDDRNVPGIENLETVRPRVVTVLWPQRSWRPPTPVDRCGATDERLPGPSVRPHGRPNPRVRHPRHRDHRDHERAGHTRSDDRHGRAPDHQFAVPRPALRGGGLRPPEAAA